MMETHPPTPAVHPRWAAARRVLVCLRWGIGDVVMELPALRGLRRAAPDARIVAVGASPAVQVIEAAAGVADAAFADAVVDVRSFGFSHMGDVGGPAERAAVGRWLEEVGPFDATLDTLHAARGFREAVWAAGGAASGACYESDQTAQNAATATGLGSIEGIARGAERGWGIAVGRDSGGVARADLAASTAAGAAADRFFERHGLTGKRPAAVAPVASLGLKRWPADRFAAVIDQLADETGGPVLLVAGPDAAGAAAVLAACQNVGRVVVVGPLHLRTTAAILSRCRMVVANDTGLLHLAAAAGASTVGIFGPTVPGLVMPPTGRAVVDPALDCPHRIPDRLAMPGCWAGGRCLIAAESCVNRVSVGQVLAAAGGGAS